MSLYEKPNQQKQRYNREYSGQTDSHRPEWLVDGSRSAVGDVATCDLPGAGVGQDGLVNLIWGKKGKGGMVLV